jgi:uncharacterized Zn-binding protein involved in type VI secretion
MSGKPAARVTDPTSCPMPGHGTNPIVSGSPDVLFDGLAAARHNDQSACGAAIVGGVSATVFINGRNAAVQSSTGDHGSIIVGGSGSVIIGDTVTAAPVSAVSAMPNLTAAAVPIVAALLPTQSVAAHPASLTSAPTAASFIPTLSTPREAAEKILDDFQKAPIKERIFNDPAHPMGTPEDPFEKNKIKEQLAARIARAHGDNVPGQAMLYPYPFQGHTSLCGPATLFYALLMDRPDLYTKAVTELWETGETTIGKLHIKPSHGARNPKKLRNKVEGDRIAAIDWITLASLRDSENLLLDYDSPDDQVSGITLPGKLKEWFKQVGATLLFENVQFSSHINQAQLVELFTYLGPHSHVATLIGAGMLDGGDGMMKNHWIAWEQGPTTASGVVTPATVPSMPISSSRIFSWGELKHQLAPGATLQTVLKHLYGGIVFSKIP